jgi:hypothetical protein
MFENFVEGLKLVQIRTSEISSKLLAQPWDLERERKNWEIFKYKYFLYCIFVSYRNEYTFITQRDEKKMKWCWDESWRKRTKKQWRKRPLDTPKRMMEGAGLLVCKCAGMKMCRNAGLQVCQFTGLPIYRFANLQAAGAQEGRCSLLSCASTQPKQTSLVIWIVWLHGLDDK